MNKYILKDTVTHTHARARKHTHTRTHTHTHTHTHTYKFSYEECRHSNAVLIDPCAFFPTFIVKQDRRVLLSNQIRLDFQLKRAIIDIALYNVTADPDERVDLSKKLPDVVKTMQERVEFYKKGTVPELNKPSDPVALEVAKKNGAWTPWRG